MAIEHCDNFSMYGTNPAFLLNGTYASAVNCALAADPAGTGNIVLNPQGGGANGEILTYALASGAITTVGSAFRVWCSRLPPDTSSATGIEFRTVSNTPLYQVAIQPNGAISLLNNGPNNVVATTTGPVVTANAWWHIEVKFTVGAGTGALEVRVEGQTVLSLTAQAFGSTGIGIVGWGPMFGTASGANPFYKDVVVWNTSGSLNNNFLGSVLVASLVTNSDVTVGGWTNTGGASHNAILAQSPPVDATVFTAAAVPPVTAMVLGMTDLPTNVTSVKALMTMVRATKVDGGDGSLQTSLVSGASTGSGANRPITTTPTYWRDVFETDPATSAPWTLTAANAANLKIDRTV